MTTQHYWLRGCGVTLQVTQDTMGKWIEYIIERGGVPAIAVAQLDERFANQEGR